LLIEKDRNVLLLYQSVGPRGVVGARIVPLAKVFGKSLGVRRTLHKVLSGGVRRGCPKSKGSPFTI